MCRRKVLFSDNENKLCRQTCREQCPAEDEVWPPSSRVDKSHDKLNASMLPLLLECCSIERGNVPYANRAIASECEDELALLFDEKRNFEELEQDKQALASEWKAMQQQL